MNNLAKLLLLTIFALLAAANTRAQCQNYRIISRLGVVEDCTSGGVSSGQILALNAAGQVLPLAPGATTGIFGIATASSSPGSTVVVLVGDGNVSVLVDNACVAGNFVVPSLSLAGSGHCASTPLGSGQIIGTAASHSSAGSVNVQISPVSSPAPGGPGGDTIFTPLLSNAVIQSITSDGANFTLTCNIANCGLTPGTAYNLGTGLPNGCADTAGDVTSVTGFTAKLANAGSCLLLGSAMNDDYLTIPCVNNSTVACPTPIIVPQATGAGENTIEVYVNANGGTPTYQVVVYVESL
jgi:hypothetical protein